MEQAEPYRTMSQQESENGELENRSRQKSAITKDDLIAEALAAGRVTLCKPGVAGGVHESQTWTNVQMKAAQRPGKTFARPSDFTEKQLKRLERKRDRFARS